MPAKAMIAVPPARSLAAFRLQQTRSSLMPPAPRDSLLISEIVAAIAAGEVTAADVVTAALRRARAYADPAVWITLFDETDVLARVREAEARCAAGAVLPLFGVP